MKESLPFSAAKAGVLCALLLAAAASNAAATRLRLDRAALDFDPNQSIWHVSSHLCNVDQAPSGNLNYHIWLYSDDPSTRSGRSHFFNLGGIRFKNVLKAGECWDFADSAIRIGYTRLTPGQYHIELIVGEWDGAKFATVLHQPFMLDNGMYQDFIKK
ncbi:MAG: hypothetical protein ACHQ51_03405 [Elusimicrobiota bacterium]